MHTLKTSKYDEFNIRSTSLQGTKRCDALSKFRFLILMLSCFFSATSAFPESYPEAPLTLYQAELRVSDFSDTERLKAFPLLLQKVLIKVSANSKVNALPSIKTDIKNAESLVDQFSYTKEMYLRASFNPEKVNALLKKAGQPVYNRERPLVIAWFFVQNNDGKTEMVSSFSENTALVNLSKSLKNFANDVGLPIVLPFGDLEDMSVLPDELWTTKATDLEQASKRYGTTVILMIKMKEGQTDPCNSNWSLLSENNDAQENPTLRWEESRSSCEASLQEGILKSLRQLLLVKKPMSTHQDETHAQNIQIFHIIVTGIQSAKDYQIVLNTLEKQPGVLDVQIDNVMPSQVSYVLHAKATLSHFSEKMMNNSQFQLLQHDDVGNQLTYEFVSNRSSMDIWSAE